MKKLKDFRKKMQKFFSKLFTRFSNYRNNKKWFVVYLVVLAICLFFFPVIEANGSNRWFLFSGILWKSSMVILIAMIGLFCWNLSISFKTWVTRLCSLREDEPLVDFLLLWIVVSVFMGVMDGVNVGVASGVTQKIGLNSFQVAIDGLLLLGGLIRSFISLRKLSQKTNKRTKIMNIVEETRQRPEPQRSAQITHLFDDLNDDE